MKLPLSLLIVAIILTTTGFIVFHNLQPQPDLNNTVTPTLSLTPTLSSPSNTPTFEPPKITPTPLPPSPTRQATPAPSSNLLQAAIEITCLLSGDPDPTKANTIYQKYHVTAQQVSDFHYQAYQKTLPPAQQSAFENGTQNCR